MILDRSVPLEAKAMADGVVVSISLLIICEPSRQVSRHKTETCICVVLQNLAVSISSSSDDKELTDLPKEETVTSHLLKLFWEQE